MTNLAKMHAGIRAHDDAEMVAKFHHFVVEHFGGDYQRAVWFLEARIDINIIGLGETYYSMRTRTHRPFYYLRMHNE